MSDQPHPLAKQLVERLSEQGLTIASAESLTGGLVSAAIAAVSGASACLRGGVCAYSAEVKASVLQVPPQVLAKCGTVAPETAEAMARGARELFGADIAIATTGVAGPDAIEGRSVGTVYLGAATATRTRTRALHLRGDRNQIRTQASVAALELALSMLD